MQLQNEGKGSLRLAFPAVIGPRYPLAPLPESQYPMEEEVAVSEGSLGPGAAPFHCSVNFTMPCSILSLCSPTHAISVSKCTQNTRAGATLTLPSMPDREIVMTVALAAPLEPRCWLEPATDGDAAAVLAVLHPDEASLRHLWPQVKAEDVCQREFVFLLDRSGSMSGYQIKKAADALQLFLRSLPSKCCFDIVGFGSTWESLFGSSVTYDAESLKKASEHVQHVQANLGGTELL